IRFLLICKRYYINKDLLVDRYGRNFELPVRLGELGHKGFVLAADYRRADVEPFEERGIRFESSRLSVTRPLEFFRRSREAVRSLAPEVIIASGDTHLGLLGMVVARLHGVPFVFDVYDNYEAFASARIPGMKWIFRFVVRRANLVLCVSTALARKLRPLTDRTLVIGNGVDPTVFYARDRRAARETLGIGADEKVVIYVGGITDTRGVRELIDAIGLLVGDGIAIRLLIVGRNQSSFDLGEPWVDYRGVVPHDRVPVYLSAADIAVLPYLPDEWGTYTHPTKLAEYMACGVPVVATEILGYREIDTLSGIRWCQPGDVGAMKSAILDQLTQPLPTDGPFGLLWEDYVRRLDRGLAQIRR
ncbi:MAG TPA: glycosyltransferase family 4 protein, partial [Acidimicrobiia bacterium]|nr:glycosyltransferase family 4 protein [Acidimicrobiia bacterium]